MEISNKMGRYLIKEAIDLSEEAAYSPAELEAYEEYWKAVSSEKTMREEDVMKGKTEGKAEGKVEGRVEGRNEAKLDIAKAMKQAGLPISTIANCTGLSTAEIENL